MAQNDGSPYSQEFLDEMRDLLGQAREWMQAGVDVEEQQIIEYIGEENAGIDQHQADDASAVYEQTLALTLRNTLSGTLAEVNDALKALDRGTYGRCERCGRWISEERLRVLPFADLCIRCAAAESGDFEPPRY
jgi:DnaK suppressor protein